MAKNKLFYIAAKALIKNREGKILLLYVGEPQKVIKHDYWDLPGGRIQEGQSALQALKTELKEEIGLGDIRTPDFLTAVLSNHDVVIDGRETGLALLIYRVEAPDNFKVALSPEHSRYEWRDASIAAERLRNKYPAAFTDLLVG